MDTRRRWIAGIATLVACSFALGEEPSSSVAARDVTLREGELVCEVHPGSNRFVVGDALHAEVRIYNLSDRPIRLVGSLDGSERRARYPHTYFDVAGPTVERPLVYCGNTNSFHELDLAVVPPGDYLDPFALQEGGRGYFSPDRFQATTLAAAGPVTITFHYSTLGADPEEWIVPARDRDRLLELLRSIPAVAISCSTTIEVLER